MQKTMIYPTPTHHYSPTAIFFGLMAWALSQISTANNVLHLLTEWGAFISMALGLGAGIYKWIEISRKKQSRINNIEGRIHEGEQLVSELRQQLDILQEENDYYRKLAKEFEQRKRKQNEAL